ncbi:MAG: hypothetical protein DRO05_03385 [Thermoproteota archaeon]|nr:MAG: hypothetical protein DRO05_03385 [Candidatus Korarchaeota archaeon]
MVITADVRIRDIGIKRIREKLLRCLTNIGLNVVEDEFDKTGFSIFAIEKRVPLWQTSLLSLIGPSLVKDRIGLDIRAFKEGNFISLRIEARLYIPELDMENPKGSDRGRLKAAGAVNFLVRELETLNQETR